MKWLFHGFAQNLSVKVPSPDNYTSLRLNLCLVIKWCFFFFVFVFHKQYHSVYSGQARERKDKQKRNLMTLLTASSYVTVDCNVLGIRELIHVACFFIYALFPILGVKETSTTVWLFLVTTCDQTCHSISCNFKHDMP